MMCLPQQINYHIANSLFKMMDKYVQILMMHLHVALKVIHAKQLQLTVNLIVIKYCKMNVYILIQSVI